MLPTGDLRGNVQRVIDHLKLVSYHLPVSSRSLKAGEPTSLLPILHYCLLDFSPHVASFVSSHGYDLYGRDDATFTTAVFRLATLHLGIQPGLQAQQFLSRGFIERKLLFVVNVMRSCLEKHGEAARAAAAASVGPVPPYISHFSLQPASASTRWNVRGTSRLEHASGKNSSALLPPQAHSLPADHGQAPSSDHIYSQGLTAREATLAGIKDAAYQFLSDAVALGTGAGASLASRRSQALHDALVSAPAVSGAMGGEGGASAAGWRERAAKDCALIAGAGMGMGGGGGGVGGVLERLSEQGLPPLPIPTHAPLLARRAPGHPLQAVPHAHPPGALRGGGTGAARDWPLPLSTQEVAAGALMAAATATDPGNNTTTVLLNTTTTSATTTASAPPSRNASGYGARALGIIGHSGSGSEPQAGSVGLGGGGGNSSSSGGGGEPELGSSSQWVQGEAGSSTSAASARLHHAATTTTTTTTTSTSSPSSTPDDILANATAVATAAALERLRRGNTVRSTSNSTPMLFSTAPPPLPSSSSSSSSSSFFSTATAAAAGLSGLGRGVSSHSPEDPTHSPAAAAAAAAATTTTTTSTAPTTDAAATLRHRTLNDSGVPGYEAAAEAVKARYAASMGAMAASLGAQMESFATNLSASLSGLEGRLKEGEEKLASVRRGAAVAAAAGASAPYSHTHTQTAAAAAIAALQQEQERAASDFETTLSDIARAQASLRFNHALNDALVRAGGGHSTTSTSASASTHAPGGGPYFNTLTGATLGSTTSTSSSSSSAPTSTVSLVGALKRTLAREVAATPALGGHHLYSLLPSSEVTHLQMRAAAAAAAGGGGLEAQYASARNTLLQAGADAAVDEVVARVKWEAKVAGRRVDMEEEESEDEAAFAAALARRRSREGGGGRGGGWVGGKTVTAAAAAAAAAAPPPPPMPSYSDYEGGVSTQDFLSSMAARFANTEAVLARNAAILRST